MQAEAAVAGFFAERTFVVEFFAENIELALAGGADAKSEKMFECMAGRMADTT